MFDFLHAWLEAQIRYLPDKSSVEILINDHVGVTVGTKRNTLLQAASGKYTVFIDDDDMVPDYYIHELLLASLSNADCFGINGTMTVNGQTAPNWNISKDNTFYGKTIVDGKDFYVRWTNHISPCRASIAKQIPFDDVSFQEDYNWCLALRNSGLLETEHIIQKPMYVYRFRSINKNG